MIKIWVRVPVWSESDKSWYILVNCTETGASNGVWFPKKCCQLEDRGDGTAALSMPKWFFDKNDINSKINKNQIL